MQTRPVYVFERRKQKWKEFGREKTKQYRDEKGRIKIASQIEIDKEIALSPTSCLSLVVYL